MPSETEPLTSPHPTSSHALIRRIGEAAPHAALSVIGHRFPSDGPIPALGRSLREQFQAITGAGLSPPTFTDERPSRLRTVSPGGAGAVGYLAAGSPSGRRVVFVHGTPGDASDWSGLLGAPATGQYRLAIDRPGFGESATEKPVVSLSEQAGAVAALLEDVGGPAVVVGSSYGGPVALRLAADRPDLVAGLLLVGGAADPGHEKIHPLQHMVAAKPLAAMMPRALAHSNAELLALRGELERLSGDLGRIRASVTILHGLGDTLVPAENARYLAERLTGVARMRFTLVAQAGHFLHLLSPGQVEDALAELLDETERFGSPQPVATVHTTER